MANKVDWKLTEPTSSESCGVTKNSWNPVVYSVLQASILRQTLLKIIINDRTECSLREFSGDTKLQEIIIPDVCCHPEGLYKLEKRVNRIPMKCSKGKFKVLSLNRNNCTHSMCWGLAIWKLALWRRISVLENKLKMSNAGHLYGKDGQRFPGLHKEKLLQQVKQIVPPLFTELVRHFGSSEGRSGHSSTRVDKSPL